MYKYGNVTIQVCVYINRVLKDVQATVYLELFPDTGDLRGSKVWREVCCGSTGRNDHPTAFMVEWK